MPATSAGMTFGIKRLIELRAASGRAHLLPQASEAAALHHRAGQRMADHIFGEIGAGDERFEIDAGLDAHLVAHEDEVLGADIARRALVPGEGAAAEAGDRSVVAAD